MNRRLQLGFPTILFVFVMICLLTFSTLSLVTANSDYKLTQKVADRNTTYYDAQGRAYQRIAAIDNFLQDCYLDAQSSEEYYSLIEKSISACDTEARYGLNQDQPTITLEEKIEDGQVLEIQLLPQYPQKDSQGYYTLKAWQTQTNASLGETTPLNLAQ